MIFHTPKYLACAGSFLAMFFMATISQAETVLVFTDYRHPLTNVGNAQVFNLDLPAAVEDEFSVGLSNDQAKAQKQALERLASPSGPKFRRDLKTASEGLLTAWQLGITKLPAAVVDERHGVY